MTASEYDPDRRPLRYDERGSPSDFSALNPGKFMASILPSIWLVSDRSPSVTKTGLLLLTRSCGASCPYSNDRPASYASVDREKLPLLKVIPPSKTATFLVGPPLLIQSTLRGSGRRPQLHWKPLTVQPQASQILLVVQMVPSFCSSGSTPRLLTRQPAPPFTLYCTVVL